MGRNNMRNIVSNRKDKMTITSLDKIKKNMYNSSILDEKDSLNFTSNKQVYSNSDHSPNGCNDSPCQDIVGLTMKQLAGMCLDSILDTPEQYNTPIQIEKLFRGQNGKWQTGQFKNPLKKDESKNRTQTYYAMHELKNMSNDDMSNLQFTKEGNEMSTRAHSNQSGSVVSTTSNSIWSGSNVSTTSNSIWSGSNVSTKTNSKLSKYIMQTLASSVKHPNGIPFTVFFRYILWFPENEIYRMQQQRSPSRPNKNNLESSLWMVTAGVFSETIGRTVTVGELRKSYIFPGDCRMYLSIPCLDGGYMHEKDEQANDVAYKEYPL